MLHLSLPRVVQHTLRSQCHVYVHGTPRPGPVSGSSNYHLWSRPESYGRAPHCAANKRVQEQQMWAARRSQLKMEQEQGRAPAMRSLSTREGSHRRLSKDELSSNKRSRITAQSRNSSESSQSDERSSSIERMDRTSSGSLDREGEESGAQPGPSADEAAEAELDALLSKRRVRGRGAVGSRADEPGPYLPVPDTGVALQKCTEGCSGSPGETLYPTSIAWNSNQHQSTPPDILFRIT